MTIAEILKQFPEIESDALLSHIIKQPKEFLYVHGDTKLTNKQLAEFIKLAKRRSSGVPLAYVIGYKYFYGLKFAVNRHVLIPRPESEWLVDKALKFIRANQSEGKKPLSSKRESKKLPKNFNKRKLKVIDVGTGSGCIAISIAKHTKNSVQTSATDISLKTLAVAQNNAKCHDVTIQFYHSDLLSGIRGKFDIIIANLPYVPVTDYIILRESLKHEPMHALTDGTDNSTLIQKFAEQALKKLAPNGIILLEIDPSSKPILQKLKKKMPSASMKFAKDLRGLWRYCLIAGTKPGRGKKTVR